jgi:hypothetical protein
MQHDRADDDESGDCAEDRPDAGARGAQRAREQARGDDRRAEGGVREVHQPASAGRLRAHALGVDRDVDGAGRGADHEQRARERGRRGRQRGKHRRQREERRRERQHARAVPVEDRPGRPHRHERARPDAQQRETEGAVVDARVRAHGGQRAAPRAPEQAERREAEQCPGAAGG